MIQYPTFEQPDHDGDDCCDEDKEANPKGPADAGAFRLFALLAGEPGVSVLMVSNVYMLWLVEGGRWVERTRA